MFLGSIARSVLSKSTKANLVAQIPLKSSSIFRPIVRSGQLFNTTKSIETKESRRLFHVCSRAFTKRTDSDRNDKEVGERVKSVDFGKPVQRVAKIIASYGQCTKGQAEVLIEEGRVKVNGEVIKEVPTKVPIDSKIYVDDVLLKKQRPRVFIHYKKRMFLAKLSFEPDSKGRRNLFAVLQAMGVPSVVPIDTLDYSSEGIMLLTNDSMYKALLVKTAKENWECLYKLKVLGEVTEKFIQKSKEKIVYQGEKLPGISIRVEESMGDKESSYTWLVVTAPVSVSHVVLKDHFKRNKIFVSRLMRLKYGPYSLDQINAGDVHEVPIKVIEKNIVKEGEQIPIITDLAEPEPKKRKLSRRELKLKNKGLYARQDKRLVEEEEEDIMDEEDYEDDIDDEDVEVKPSKKLTQKRAFDRQVSQAPKKTNAFDKNKPLKGRFASTKSREKRSFEKKIRRDEFDEDEVKVERDSNKEKSFSSKFKSYKGNKPSQAGSQNYKSNWIGSSREKQKQRRTERKDD